jgi:hypothetical protein
MSNSENQGMGSLQESNLQKFVSTANLQPNFEAQPQMSNNILTVYARRKTSTDHLYRKPMPRNRLVTSEIACGTPYRPKQLPVSICTGKNHLKHVNGER